MNAKVCRTQDELLDATDADLVETYNALTGKSVLDFASREVAQAQCSMAILAAQDAAAHRGVPKGTRTPPTATVEELGGTSAAQQLELPIGAATLNPHPPESKSARLWEAAKEQTPIAPRPRAEKRAAPSEPRKRAAKFQATGAGVTKLNPASLRCGALRWIEKQPDQTVTMDALRKEFGAAASGYVNKLLGGQHIRTVE